MDERIKRFDDWFITAKPGDKYIYHTGSLAVEKGHADGFELRKLSEHVFNKCCSWDLSSHRVVRTNLHRRNDRSFQRTIRLDRDHEKTRAAHGIRTHYGRSPHGHPGRSSHFRYIRKGLVAQGTWFRNFWNRMLSGGIGLAV